MAQQAKTELAWAGFFVSHTLADAEYCQQLILPTIAAAVDRLYNQYVFMDYKSFGRKREGDGFNANTFATRYARDINRLLRDSQAMFLVASPAATHSAWVKYEVDWWVENRSLEELIVIIREPCVLSSLNPGVMKCVRHDMYDPESAANVERLRAIVNSLIPR